MTMESNTEERAVVINSIPILNVKLPDPLLAEMLIQQSGFFRGYHISRGNWVSILLDGSVPFEEVCRWLEESYLTTASRQKKQKMRPPIHLSKAQRRI